MCGCIIGVACHSPPVLLYAWLHAWALRAALQLDATVLGRLLWDSPLLSQCADTFVLQLSALLRQARHWAVKTAAALSRALGPAQCRLPTRPALGRHWASRTDRRTDRRAAAPLLWGRRTASFGECRQAERIARV
jgi:hypothetical protein